MKYNSCPGVRHSHENKTPPTVDNIMNELQTLGHLVVVRMNHHGEVLSLTAT